MPTGSKKPSATWAPVLEDIDLILATDAEQIFGIGDWGVGGIEISIGKLAIYTAAGGIDPTRVIPVMLDVGTNRESLLADPMYPGNRHARVRGERYDAFIDAYVKAVVKLFPNALLQWEDFGPGNGRRILEKYRGQIPTFSDDLQGTGAITLAAAVSAMRICGTLLRNQRIVIFGTGVAGIGIADLIRDVMIDEGLPAADATRRFWCVDVNGLLTDDMGDRLHDYQATYARTAAEVKNWRRDGANGIDLAEVIRQVRPTMLIGASGATGAFTEADRAETWHGTPSGRLFSRCQSGVARRGHARRSDRVDRGTGVDRDRQPVHAGDAQRHHARHRSGEQRDAVPGPGPGTIVSRARADQRRHAGRRGECVVEPGCRAFAGRFIASAYRRSAKRDR